jgi:hypothetical protein
VEFDASTLAAALSQSVHSLLTARVDQLAPRDRVLLQAASVIGRRFDPQLLAVAVGETDIDVRLAPIRAIDLVRVEYDSNEYTFKHALIRDALYQSLLGDARKMLHEKIAEEIERRGGNRLAEMAESLAHHYGQTDHTEKAFAFLSMAGSKCLGVYSIDEAMIHFTAALALLEKPNCASDDQVADFLVPYTLLLNLCLKLRTTIDVLQRFSTRIDRLGDDPRVVLIRHKYIFALLWNGRYRDAFAMQQETSPIADRLGDSRSLAYSLAGEIHVSTVYAPKPLDEYEVHKRDAITAASDTEDAHIQNWTRWVIGWEEFHRGRMTDANISAHELMQVGRTLADPRSIGLGLALLTWIALVSDNPAQALEYSEQSLAVAVTPFDRNGAVTGMGAALILLRRIEEGLKLSEDNNRRCAADGDLYTLNGSEGIMAVGKVLQGNIGQGIRFLEDRILKRDKDGYRSSAHWYRIFLAEVYLQIIAGNERPPLLALLKNLPIILKVMLTASSRIPALMRPISESRHFDPNGHHIGHVKMILGMLYKAKKKRALAIEHLTEAERIFEQFGLTPILARVETALAELRH